MVDALHNAARNGDLARLRAALATGVDVDAPESGSSWPALHCAASYGRLACLEALLAAGASVHSVTRIGWLALDYASVRGHVACVRALIAAGSDVNHANRYGNTPFTHALHSGHRRVLKILLRAGADVHTRNVTRRERNAAAWALVDEIREVGGWPNYVARHPPATFARVVEKATKLEIDAINLEIATFLEPPGGFS